MARSFHVFQAPLDLLVEFFTVVGIECQGGVYLTESQGGVLEADFFGAPSIRDLLLDELYDFHGRSGNDGRLLLIQ